jgi:hypothetical protein
MNTTQLISVNRLRRSNMVDEVNSDLKAGPLRGLSSRVALTTFAVLLAGPVTLLAKPSGQTVFASPEDASRALLAAIRQQDERAITRILGTKSELVSSGDQVQDIFERERFVQKYEQMHRFVQEPGGVTALYIGAENWPFPIPLVSRGGDGWRFDSDGGLHEVRFRRIGENEVTAIGICHALVAAQTHPGADTEADGLLNTVLPNLDHTSAPVPFHGYYFHVLSRSSGGFAAIAYPAVYRSSGVETFVIDQDDVVYEKDLGRNTPSVAKAITTYPSGPTWTPAESIR